MAQANLKSKISIDNSAFSAGLRKAEAIAISTASTMSSKFASVAKGVGLIGLGLAGLKFNKLLKATQHALDFKGALEKAWAELKSIQSSQNQFSDFGLAMVNSLKPTIAKVFKFLDNVDFYKAGQRLGQALQTGVDVITNAFKQGKLSELIFLSLKTGALTGSDFLVSALRGSVNAIQEILGQAMAALGSPDFWESMVQGFIAAANRMAANLLSIFEGPLKALQDGITFLMEKMTGNGRSFADIQAQDKFSLGGISSQDLAQNATDAEDKASAAWKRFQETGIVSIGAIQKAFTDAIEAGGPFAEQAKEAQNQLNELVQSLRPAFREMDKPIQSQVNYFERPWEDEEKTPRISNQAASQLERVGALVPGQQQMAINHARETATHTRKIGMVSEKILQELQRIGTNETDSVAVFGV